MFNRTQASNASTEIDTSVARQEYITNQALDEHGCTTRCTRVDRDTEAHCRTRFESVWIKEFAEAEAANRTVDVVPIDPNSRGSEPVEPAAVVGGQRAAMEKNAQNDQAGTRKLVRNPVVERDGWTSCQLDENQLQTMDGSLNQNATITATLRTAETPWTTNLVAGCIGGLRNVAGHQAERADVLLPIEAMKFYMNTTADVCRQYEHCDGKLRDRNKHVVKYFSVIRRGKKSEGSDCTQMRMAAIPSEFENLVRLGGFADAQALKVFSMSTATAASQRHTEHVHRNRGRVFAHRHG